MNAEVKKILSDLKARKYAPVYFLQGEDDYYIDLISDYIEANVLTDAEKSFNQVVMYGKDVKLSAIVGNARRFPMMADRQVVIVKEAQEILDLNASKEPGVKLFIDYLNNPVPTTLLLLCHKHKTIDKRKELGKVIGDKALVFTSKEIYDNQLPEFVHEYMAQKKIGIEEKAVATLCEYVGKDLTRLTNEIDKLLMSHKSDGPITQEIVMNFVGVSKEYNIFELQKAILGRDVLLANKIVNYVDSNTKKNPVIPIIAFLFSFFSKALAASSLADKSEQNIRTKLSVSPYAVRDYSAALRLFSPAKLMENVMLLKEADLKIKGVNAGEVSHGQILREVVYRIMH